MSLSCNPISKKLCTTVKHSKNSICYVKRNPETNKRLSQLTVYNSGSKKGQYIYHSYENNGDIITLKYDPEISARSLLIKKRGKQETLLSTLYSGIKGLFEWYKDIYNPAGKRVKQVICTSGKIYEHEF